MSNDDDSKYEAGGRGGGAPADDPIAKLIHLAGPRGTVPAAIERRVHDRVRTEWRRSIVRGRTLRWGIPLALAASVVIAVTVAYRTPDEAPRAVLTPVATIVRINGAPAAAANRPSPGLLVGGRLYAGDTIATAAGQGISLRMNGNLSLRVAGETTLRIDSADAVTLASGRVYADSGEGMERAGALTVTTDAGVATDVGTQFAVAYRRGEMSVAVREGQVDVSGHNRSWTADSGDRLVLRPNSGVTFERVAKYGDYWDWAVALAPAFDINNRPLHEFLEWAARETGKQLEYASDDVRRAAMLTDVRGASVADLTPSEALQAVLPTTHFDFRIDERRIVIGE
ncbi:MAG TPA: FecR family protein [Woeseiaceae bacterium]|nr:FecR family protein [Woeseiaceae bacterium]